MVPALLWSPFVFFPGKFNAPKTRSFATRACHGVAEWEPLTSDGGVRKRVLRPAPRGGIKPDAGAFVSVIYTCKQSNGTVLDDKHAANPFDFQLGDGSVILGLEKGVASMRVGEYAELSITPRWAHGLINLDKRVPGDAPLHFDIELINSREGSLENDPDDFDIHMYRSSLEGRPAAEGRTSEYTWSETSEEVTLWLKLQDNERAKDISVEFGRQTLSVRVGEIPYIHGELRGEPSQMTAIG